MRTNNIGATALVTDIQRFCMHDGPGVRTTVFFKGCPLHCKWCHNPETQSARPEIMFTRTQCISCGACESVCENSAHKTAPERTFDRAVCVGCGKCTRACPTSALSLSGKKMSIGEMVGIIKKDLPFYGDAGGLTVSGGEPTMRAKSLVSLLGEARALGISTAVETCGFFSERLAEELCGLVDIFLFDVKDTNGARLRENTGADIEVITKNLRFIDRMGADTVLRCILIPGVNMDSEHAHGIAELYAGLSNCRYVELLPYHPFGTSKSDKIGMAAQRIYDIPEKKDVLDFADKLRAEGVTLKYYGTETT